jgi:hypothetical protein
MLQNGYIKYIVRLSIYNIITERKRVLHLRRVRKTVKGIIILQ